MVDDMAKHWLILGQYKADNNNYDDDNDDDDDDNHDDDDYDDKQIVKQD